MENSFRMSLFMPPISPIKDKATGRIVKNATLTPLRTVELSEVYKLVTANAKLAALTLAVRNAVQLGDDSVCRLLKQQTLPYVTPCGVFTRRRSDCIEETSGLVVVDVDHLESNEEARKLRQLLFEDTYLHPVLVFISPTGKGVKAFVPCASGQSATDGIRWAMSYVHCMYDTDVHIGTAFHLAELCGVKIEYENPGAVGTVGTEVRPPSGTHTRTRVKEVYSQEKNDFSCEEETSSGSAPLSPLPTFDKNIRWPYPLEHIMSCATSDAQSDVLLLGALNVLGATMGPHVRCAYGGKMVSPCMQTFTSANSASGKGVLSLVRLLVEPFHDEIRKQVAERMVCYQRDKAKYDALEKNG